MVKMPIGSKTRICSFTKVCVLAIWRLRRPIRCAVWSIDAAGSEDDVGRSIFDAVSRRLLPPAALKQASRG